MLPESNEYIDANMVLQSFVNPWYESLKNPSGAQLKALMGLLKGYGETEYGKRHGADKIGTVAEYQKNFPMADYDTFKPYFGLVREGNYRSFLPEPPETWVMTRGSTGKQSKVIPATPTHLRQIYLCGARAIIHFALRTEEFDVLTGNILNLNFPSGVHSLTQDGKELSYGYSSGTYARLNPLLSQVSLLPRQEDIDALGAGVSRADWQRRFELAYEQALEKNVTAVMGVTPVILAFAKYIKHKHSKTPADLWRFHALFCTSVCKIQFKYAPIMQKYFGKAPVVEMYTATEGVFAQQYDDLPYVTPNFDAYFFEVAKPNGQVKQLHELKRGEWGRLIVSSCMLPRYDIGDMVESAGGNYFRIFGRRNAQTLLEHKLYRAFLGWLL
jgi:hypothetical protein